MSPKEKAIQLIDKFDDFTTRHSWRERNDDAIECALVAINEILNSTPSRIYWNVYDDEVPSAITYWQEVKQEIEKL